MKTFLFDFDGTLVDSMPAYASCMLRILDENGISYKRDIIKVITPLGLLGTAHYFRELGVTLSVEEIIGKMKEYLMEEYEFHIPAKPHVVEVLQKLKQSGAGLNVLTASPHVTLDACLRRLGIFDWFDHVWSCDDFGTTKADPNIYRMAAEKIGKPVEEIWFLDDNLSADTTAKEAGMQVCGVYDSSSAEYMEEMRAVTDAYVMDFVELWEWYQSK